MLCLLFAAAAARTEAREGGLGERVAHWYVWNDGIGCRPVLLQARHLVSQRQPAHHGGPCRKSC